MYSEENIQTASSYQALAQAHFKLQEGRKGLAAQEKAVQLYQKLLPVDSAYVKQAKSQLDYYFRLSVDIEKRKKLQKENKGKVMIDQEELIKAIQEQQRLQREAIAKAQAEGKLQKPDEAANKEPSKEEEKPKQMSEEEIKAAIAQQQRQMEVNAFQQRYNRLIQRINNPKQRTQLDILEWQAMQDQVNAIRETKDKPAQAEEKTE